MLGTRKFQGLMVKEGVGCIVWFSALGYVVATVASSLISYQWTIWFI